MKVEKHLEKYKQMRATINQLMKVPKETRDSASITTLAHWTSFPLVSITVNQLPIPERL